MASVGDNIGMMEGAFFVGRKVILDWINEFLALNLGRIEETCSGAVACQLCDSLYPGKVNMSKVRWDAKADFEYVQNYKVLQDCFNKVGISKRIPVQLLIRGKYQDNLEFMQWMKRFFELNTSGDDYSATERRSKGKGGKKFIGKGKVQKKTTSRDKRDRFNAAAGAKATTKRNSTTSSSTTQEEGEPKENRRASNRTKQSSRTKPTGTSRRTRPTSTTNENVLNGSSAQVATLQTKVSTLTSEKADLAKSQADLQMTVDGLEKERDFYFGKLRDIEILLQSVDEDESEDFNAEEQLKTLIERGLKILYATEGEDFVAVSDQVEAVQVVENVVVQELNTEAEPAAISAVTEVGLPSPAKDEENIVEQKEEVTAEVTEGKEGVVVETF